MGKITKQIDPSSQMDLPAKPSGMHWSRYNRLAERFEVYICGLELANGFGELIDPAEQRARFLADQARKQALYGHTYPIDEDFLAALEHGLPDCAGIALGFDRNFVLVPVLVASLCPQSSSRPPATSLTASDADRCTWSAS